MYVILFDGVCNLCNASINWVIDHDKKNVFKFASLQSAYGIEMVKKFGVEDRYLDTIILIEDDKYYERSTAVLRIAKHMGGIWAWGYAFIIVPPFIRNFIYGIVAKNRYKWFGKQDACRIPTPDLKAKFLE